MTPEQAYDLAKFQRPGVRLVVGPTEAREEPVPPFWLLHLHQLPGDASWWVRDAKRRLGFEPHPIAEFIGRSVEGTTGRQLTREEWEILQNGSVAERDQIVRSALKRKEASL